MTGKELFKNAYKKMRTGMRRKDFFSHQENSFNLSPQEIKRAMSLGFTPDEYVIYDLQHNNPDAYISEYERSIFRVHFAPPSGRWCVESGHPAL